jgi:hypothetical protein
MESRSSERRKAPHLPAPTAATVQSARDKANSIITNTLNRIAGNRPAEVAQQGQENEYKMEVGHSPPPGQRNGSGNSSGSGGGTAASDPGRTAKSGKAKKKSNNIVDPAAAGTSRPAQDGGPPTAVPRTPSQLVSQNECTRTFGGLPATEIRT